MSVIYSLVSQVLQQRRIKDSDEEEEWESGDDTDEDDEDDASAGVMDEEEAVAKCRPRTATDTKVTKKKGAKSTVKQTKSQAKSTEGKGWR